MPFTKREIQQAYNTSILNLVRNYGYDLKQERNVFRVKDISGGLYIWNNGLGWFHHDTQERGNGIQFLQNYCDVSDFTTAVRLLLDEANITPAIDLMRNDEIKTIVKKEDLVLPEAFNGRYNNLMWYLIGERKLSQDIVMQLMQDKAVYQDVHRNCVFVSYDEFSKQPKYATLHGTYKPDGYTEYYKGEALGSDKSYGWVMKGTNTERLFVFESPIDAISHATLREMSGADWRADTRISLGGTAQSSLKRYLSQHKDVKQLVFCLDNDYHHWDKRLQKFYNVGQNAIRGLAKIYSGKYTINKIQAKFPYKDFNEFLQSLYNPQAYKIARDRAKADFAEHNSMDMYYELFPEEKTLNEILQADQQADVMAGEFEL